MDPAIASFAATASAAKTRGQLGMAMTRMAAESQQAIAALLAQSAEAGKAQLAAEAGKEQLAAEAGKAQPAQPAPGTETRVDRLA